ncbi:PP2C family protein-serine/threonine phosphatase [Streptomyces sp. NPDC001594]|uniref:PP2C family protein-serine/threonine phosphatase n=1 Tax=Streptomyces sp. NPDC001594 TaxID=3364590 RepID=UPI003681F5E3
MSDRDGHPSGRTPHGDPHRAPSPAETLEAIGTGDDETTTCRELAAFVLRTLADAAAVDLAVEGRTERVAAAGAVGLLRAPAPVPVGRAAVRAVDEGHPLRSWTLRPGASPVHGLSVALTRHGTSYGTLLAVRTGSAFTDREAAALHFAARVAAVQVRHARRLAATERVALDLQRALVAGPGRPHPNLLIAGRYLPVGPSALVGGDWFEAVRLHFGRTLLVVGDVMGHGLDAAVDMNAYRSTLREVASTELAPHRVLRQLDALVAGDAARRPATCLLARVDPARGTALFACAGHLPPAVFAADGTGRLLDVPVGPPLGTGLGGYESAAHPFTGEDTLVLYTDGLVERRGEDIEDSLARLTALRLPAGASAAEAVDALVAGLDARHAEDDVAVLTARIRSRPAHP